MRRDRRRLATALVAGVTMAVMAPPAAADRRPSKSERAAIKAVAIKGCASPPRACRFKRARVSTRNARYAWASVVGEGISGVLVKRRTAHARRFKRVGVQGGGVRECSYWRSRAPAGVLRDLHVKGLHATGAIGNCG